MMDTEKLGTFEAKSGSIEAGESQEGG